jgi:hypothetical protein
MLQIPYSFKEQEEKSPWRIMMVIPNEEVKQVLYARLGARKKSESSE